MPNFGTARLTVALTTVSEGLESLKKSGTDFFSDSKPVPIVNTFVKLQTGLKINSIISYNHELSQ